MRLSYAAYQRGTYILTNHAIRFSAILILLSLKALHTIYMRAYTISTRCSISYVREMLTLTKLYTRCMLTYIRI